MSKLVEELESQAEESDNVGRLLQQTFKDFKLRMHVQFESLGYTDVTTTQAELLAMIRMPSGSSIAAIAQSMTVSKQAAGEMVGQLEQAGYVRKLTDPRDGRGVLVQLNSRGKQLIHEAHSIKARIEQEYIAVLGRKQFNNLKHYLETILNP